MMIKRLAMTIKRLALVARGRIDNCDENGGLTPFSLPRGIKGMQRTAGRKWLSAPIFDAPRFCHGLLAGALLAASVTGAYGAEKKLPPWEKPVQAGRFLYREHCSVCHEINKPESKKLGPGLHRVFEMEKMPFSGLPVSEQFIGIKMKVGGGIMPAFFDVLSDDEIDKIIQFMKAKK
jgi:hypothetical protein